MCNSNRRLVFWCLLVFLTSWLPTFLWAQEPTTEQLMIYMGLKVGRPGLNQDLPPQVPTEPGKVTFFADYASSDKRGVPLYLVNRSNAPLNLASQDNDIYVKLEHQLPNGRWERAQPHSSSWCGNSYYPVVLNPGQHFKFYGYMPSSGVKARIRFASHSDANLVSNEGDGFVQEKDVQEARLDSMSRNAPSPIAEVLDPERRVRPDQPLPVQKQVAAVRLLQVYGGNLFYKQEAEKLVQAWKAKPSPSKDEKEGAKIIQGLLAGPWSLESNPESMFKRCIEALNAQNPKATAFGMPEQDRTMVWGVLAGLAESTSSSYFGNRGSQSLELRQWLPVLKLIPEAFRSKDHLQINAATRIVGIGPLADELLPNSFFEENLLCENEWVQRVCANTLSRRMQWQKLTEIGWKLPSKSQVIVLGTLAYPRESLLFSGEHARSPDFNGEEKFWQHCVETMPIESSYALYSSHASEYNPFNRIVHDPLRDYFAKEAERSDAASEDFELKQEGYMSRMAVEFLATWHLEEDTPVLQKLLGYRGYFKQHAGRTDPKNPNLMQKYVAQVYPVRAAAKEALLKRGVPVPQDLIVEKDLIP